MKTLRQIALVLTIFTVVCFAVLLSLNNVVLAATCVADCGGGSGVACEGASCDAEDGVGCNGYDSSGKRTSRGECLH